ncbi:TonB-dependent receptor [Pedobacter sp. AW31-3R]|uniref:TonB-dependent receptor n=1 Tax=Pedobacter sp. AW31-3R TaxID=3445781 RepID=UPI003FA061EA
MYSQVFQLSGKLCAEGKNPLPQVRIRLDGSGKMTTSNAQGEFILSGIAAGSYTLHAELEGYHALTLLVKGDRQPVYVTAELIKKVKQLQEIKVRERREEELRREESLNVETLGSDFIQRNLGGSLMKTLERVPGIKTIGIGSGQSKPLIRGLGFNRVVVVDKGVKHEGQQWGADHGLEIDQFAASGVQLIKGAASFLYGSDAIGGVIQVLPAPVPAANTFGGSAELIGKSNNQQYGGSVNLFGRQQHWFANGRFTWQRYSDYRVPADTVFVYDYAVRLHEQRLRNTAGLESAAHLDFGYAGDRFKSVFSISNVYSKSGFFANAHGLEPRRVDTLLHDRSASDILMPSQEVNHLKIINRTSYYFSGHLLEMELGFQHNFRQEYSAYVNHGYMPPVYPDTLPDPSTLEREFDKKVYSLNLRDHYQIGNHSITGGLNAEFQQNSIAGWSFLVPAFEQFTAGSFLYDKYKLSEQWILHGATRYDYGHLKLSPYADWFPSPAGEGSTAYLVRANVLSRSFNSFVWSAGVNYNPGKFSLKFNMGKSFRMPIAKELGANGVNYHYFSYEKGNAALSPEQSYQADVSLQWTDERWSVQLSPFYNYFPNYIYLNPTAEHDFTYGAGNQVFQYAQSKVERFGAELQVKYKLSNSFSTTVLGEYLSATQLSGDKKGYTLPFSPPASALFNLTYAPADGDFLKGTYVSADYRLTASQHNIVPPERETPGYQVLNIQAGTQLKMKGTAFQLSLQVQNLMDTRYLNHTSFYRLIALPEAGRNIVLSLKVPFSGRIKH